MSNQVIKEQVLVKFDEFVELLKQLDNAEDFVFFGVIGEKANVDGEDMCQSKTALFGDENIAVSMLESSLEGDKNVEEVIGSAHRSYVLNKFSKNDSPFSGLAKALKEMHDDIESEKNAEKEEPATKE